ncbi:hypothetical protein ACIRP0_11980 [Streptomyces sp. NPDC101733]|uniref:hypothetical protein n=1 Tax=unclassified Streptomyces TaxID=2593676 RepID=UPI003440D851
MTLSHALRAALVTVAIAGAAVLGAQVAQADGPSAPLTNGTAVTDGGAGANGTNAGPDASPSPTASTKQTNPWD